MNNVLIHFTDEIKTALNDFYFKNKTIEEIRLRVNKPVCIKTGNTIEFLDIISKAEDLEFLLRSISDYSLYAFNEELTNGYITIPGGHRVGICGQVVSENKKIIRIKNFCSVNFRIATQHIGISNGIIHYLFDEKGNVLNSLIMSPPGRGKTSLLRDVIRNISDKGFQISLIDERSEVAACYRGIPQNDVGKCTDVFDMAPKSEGMIMALRTMAPGVIAVDEINADSDMDAVKEVYGCGVALICTMHSDTPKLNNHCKHMFNRIVFIGTDRKYRIYDENGKELT